MKILLKILMGFIGFCLFPLIHHSIEIALETPEHCGQLADLISEHTSLFGTKRLYQCQVCKTVIEGKK